MVARLRLVLALFVFALYSVPAAAHLYGGWLVRVLARTRPAKRRRFAAEWSARWVGPILKAVCKALDIRMDFDIPEEIFKAPSMPVVVVANHRKTLDILILTALLRRLGRPAAVWVLKKELLHRAVYLGHSCWMSGSAFVGRSGDEDDLIRIARSARMAAEAGTSYVIFPEGTRFSARKRREGFAEVLPPKRGGFAVLRESLPEYPVLSVTLHWQDKEGRTMFDSHTIVGRRLRVTCALHPPEAVSGGAWLDAEWRRKDQELRQSVITP